MAQTKLHGGMREPAWLRSGFLWGVNAGAEVRGDFVWSLLDNFE